jgi:hypothetical protein
MFRIEEQGKHLCYNWLFSYNVLVSSNFDFLLLPFVLNALFMVLLCFFLVVKLKLPHVLLFSSLYFWCIVLVISSFLLVVKTNMSCFVNFIFGVFVSFFCHETNKLLSCVSSTSSLLFLCLLLVVNLVNQYFVFHHLQCLVAWKLQIFNHCYIKVGLLVFCCVFKG